MVSLPHFRGGDIEIVILILKEGDNLKKIQM